MDDIFLRTLLGLGLLWSAVFFLAFRAEIADLWRHAALRSARARHAKRSRR
jgi:hypothetical protein